MGGGLRGVELHPRRARGGPRAAGAPAFNGVAVAWSEAHFDHSYQAQWCPTDVPVLRLWGDGDRIVSQHGWRAPASDTPNVMAREIAGAGHFPWIEAPSAVARAFDDLALAVRRGAHR